MADHGARDHAAWSASASARNWRCPGAMALISDLGVVDKESRAAAWGTACHQIAEHCLRENQDAAEFIGRSVKTKSFSFEFDQEMAEVTQSFLDYVNGRLAGYHAATDGRTDCTLLVEQKFDLAPIKPPMQAGGTGDAVLLFPAWGLIEIVDLKTGMGWVAADENLQLRTYALGAMLANPGAWRRVRATIVQPRVGSGEARWEEIDFADLLDWTLDLKDAMEMCAAASRGFEIRGSEPKWAKDYLRPGDHCDKSFCPARAGCPALQSKALEAAHTFFKPEGDIAPPPDPKSLPVEKVVAVLDAADMIEGWLNAVRAHAREMVEGGREVGSYILVAKRAVRKWREEDQTALLNDITCATNLTADDVFEKKVKSPAQIEKLIGKKNAGKISDLITQESSGTNLVRSDKTSREAVVPSHQQLFKVET